MIFARDWLDITRNASVAFPVTRYEERRCWDKQNGGALFDIVGRLARRQMKRHQDVNANRNTAVGRICVVGAKPVAFDGRGSHRRD